MNTTKLAGLVLAGLLVSAGAVAALPGAVPGDAPAHDEANEHANDAPANEDADDASANDTAEQTEERDPADENETSDTGANESENASDAANASETAASDRRGPPARARGSQGPPAEMPDRVPDHVSQIHDAIENFLGGSVDNLGDVVSGLTPGHGGQDRAQDGGQNTTAPSPDENANEHARG